MFTGHTFLVSPTTSALTVAALTQHGGAVVYDVDTTAIITITCAVVADERDASVPTTTSPAALSPWLTTCAARGGRSWPAHNGLASALQDRLRAERIPVVYELWVHRCLRAQRLLPLRDCERDAHAGRLVASHPRLFAGLRFTTTQLPLQLKANIVALLQFYGATYHRHLLDTTNTVVYSHMQLRPHRPTNSNAAAAVVGGSRGEDAQVDTPPRRNKEGSPLSTSSTFRDPAASVLRSPPAAAVVHVNRASVSEAACHDTSTKLSVARARGLNCVTPQWIQQCLNAATLLPVASVPSMPAVPSSKDPRDAAPPCTHNGACVSVNGCSGEVSEHVDGEEERAKIEQWLLEVLAPTSAPSCAREKVYSRATPPTTPAPFATTSAEEITLDTDLLPAATPPKRTRDTAAVAVEADPDVCAALRLADKLAAARLRKRRRYR